MFIRLISAKFLEYLGMEKLLDNVLKKISPELGIIRQRYTVEELAAAVFFGYRESLNRPQLTAGKKPPDERRYEPNNQMAWIHISSVAERRGQNTLPSAHETGSRTALQSKLGGCIIFRWAKTDSPEELG
jgi:hypothetical protein